MRLASDKMGYPCQRSGTSPQAETGGTSRFTNPIPAIDIHVRFRIPRKFADSKIRLSPTPSSPIICLMQEHSNPAAHGQRTALPPHPSCPKHALGADLSPNLITDNPPRSFLPWRVQKRWRGALRDWCVGSVKCGAFVSRWNLFIVRWIIATWVM